MKRLFAFIVVFVTLLLPLIPLGVVGATSLNLVANPSVEQSSNGTTPDGWSQGNWGTNTTSFTYDSTAANSGTHSLKVQMSSYSSGDAKWYFTPVNVSAGTTYSFSDYYKATVATDAVVQFDNGSAYQYLDLGAVAAASTWTQVSRTFVVPTGYTHATVFHLINAIGTLETDDYSLTTATSVSVQVASPVANSTVSGSTLITATASSTSGIAGVQFQVDGVNVGAEVTTSPYQTSWDTTTATNGTHNLTAIAQASDGTLMTSSPIKVTVNNVQPGTNLITNPSLETPNPTNATLPQGWQSGDWGTNTTTFTYVTTAGQKGTHSVEVAMTAYTSGDAKWYFTPVSVTSGTTYSFSDYYMSSTTTDVTAQFDNGNGTYSYVDFGSVAPSPSAWKQFTTSFTVPAGMTEVTVFHLLNSVGTLQTDNYSLASVSIPTVAVTTPVTNTTVSGTAVSLTATAADTLGIKNVQFKVDGVNVGTALTVAPYQTTWDSTTVANGTHTITATATNTKGTAATSTAVNVTVNNTTSGNMIANPSVETASPTNSKLPLDWQSDSWGTNTVTFTYTGAANAHTGSHGVQVKMSNYTSGDGKWFFNPVPVTPDTQYQFSDYYKATIATEVDVVFTMSDGSTLYQIIGLPDASKTTWTNFTTTFTVPSGAQTMTVYHLIHGNGTLTLDDESLTPYTSVGFNRPLVTLTFDDGYDNEYTQGLPLLQKYGFNSTQFIITDLVGTSGYLTVAQVQALAQAGQEIGSHTITHNDLLTETKAQYDNELSQSQAQLVQWIGMPVTDLAFPYGLYNGAILNDTKTYYTASRGVEDGLNSKNNFNQYDIKVQNIFTTTTTAQVADWVAQAQATNTWLVLVYHSVNPISTDIYNVTPDQLDSQLGAIKASGVTVETMAQALNELIPQL